jgi:hypothetical protein
VPTTEPPTTAAPTTEPPTTEPPTTAAPTTEPPAAPTDSEPPLAVTGVEIGGIALTALIALVGGGLALAAGRRRRGENRAH